VLVKAGELLCEKSTKEAYANHEQDREIIGTALCALYQAATCHRECHGWPHFFESMAGRAYNLGIGSCRLIMSGLYDEAFTLMRSIGEISNLISLSVVDKAAISEWLKADKKTRINKFGPAAIRKKLKNSGNALMYANDDWYSEMCERFTHISPSTRPNMHNANQAMVGGIYQKDGMKKAFSELATVLCFVAMIVCRYFKFDDLFEEISAIMEHAPSGDVGSGRAL
jgi:hypothetical protein